MSYPADPPSLAAPRAVMALVVPLAPFDGFVFHPVRGLDATPPIPACLRGVEVRADDGVVPTTG